MPTFLRSAVLLGGLAGFAIAQAQPTIHDVYPNGANQFQSTNLLSFGASSTGPDINATGISVQLTSLNLLGQTKVTNLTSANGLIVGGTTTERTVGAPLTTNIMSYTAVIVVTDVSARSTTNTVKFDTLTPNLIIEAEDFNYADQNGAGQFITNSAPGDYNQLGALEGTDAHSINIGNGQLAYRLGGMNTESAGDIPHTAPDYDVGWTDGGEWGNYTRIFPPGIYNVYMRAARGDGGNGGATMSFVTSDRSQPNQTTSDIGTFTIPSTGNWQSYSWFPLKDAGGALIQVNLSGTETLRVTTVNGYNANFYAFFLANTNLPTIHNIYPDGAKLYQVTNALTFVASSASGIDPSGISVVLTATNLIGQTTVTTLTSGNGLTIGGTSTDRSVSAPLQTNITFYKADIQVTDLAANTAVATVNFNTLVPSYTFEAEDFDYDGGQHIDTPQTNGYAGKGGFEGIDAHHNNPTGPYRTSGYYTEGASDKVRGPYDGTGQQDYDLGFNDGGFWANYTHVYPAGTYNVFMRGANGGGGNGTATWAEVISGAGTSTQTTTNIGTFTIPPTTGWQTYTWVALRDTGGNLAKVTGGALKTFRVTAGGSFNPNFYAFFPADTSLPVIDQISPDGTALFQYTNVLKFRVSSSAGIATGNIVVTLDGSPVSGLIFTGSSTSWNVSYTNLPVNTTHTVTITVTANNSAVKSTTLAFDTFKASYYQMECEDYDHDGGQFIDNPQVDGYAGMSAILDMDFHSVALGGNYTYRSEGTATDPINDLPRAQFGTNYIDYNIGFFENGEWGNYTRHYPVGTYNMWARISTGAGSTTTADIDMVTSGLGTYDQTTVHQGTFSIPSNGWDTYNWVRLNDTNGNAAVVTIVDSPTTLRLGRAVATVGANANFMMLVPVLAPIPITVTRTGNNNAISLPTQSGFTYQVQYKNSLSDPAWTNVGGSLSGNDTVQTVNDSSSGASRFYRAKLTQP